MRLRLGKEMARPWRSEGRSCISEKSVCTMLCCSIEHSCGKSFNSSGNGRHKHLPNPNSRGGGLVFGFPFSSRKSHRFY